MGNGKQRGRARERETKGEGTGMGNKESPREGMGNGKQRGRAWATGNKGGGHGNGKQRVYSRWKQDTSTADAINDLSFCMCLWYHLVGRKPDLLDDLVCPDGTTEQHLASGRLC